MKKGILLMLLASSSIHAACPQVKNLEGEIVSYQKIQGKVQDHRFYNPIGDSLTEHMGDFKNIRYKSKEKFEWIEVLNRKYPVFKEGDFWITKNLHLTKRVYEELKPEVEIHFGKKERVCSRKFQGAIGD